MLVHRATVRAFAGLNRKNVPVWFHLKDNVPFAFADIVLIKALGGSGRNRFGSAVHGQA